MMDMVVDQISSKLVVSYERGCVPHVVVYPEFMAATAAELESMRPSEDVIAFLFESSRPFTITDYAMRWRYIA